MTVKKEAEKNVATTQETPVAEPKKSFVTKALEEMQRSFLEANPDMDLDFVYMTKYLSIDSKGNFIEKANDEVVKNFTDSMDVLIVKGEQKYSVWGKEGSPEDGELIVAEDKQEKAEEILTAWLDRNPHAAERYSVEDIQPRYVAYIMPIENIQDETPEIYTINLPRTSRNAFAKWTADVFKGAYKAKGIPKNTGVNQIITNISTVSKTNNQKQNYTLVQFDAVEMFKPEKFNLK